MNNILKQLALKFYEKKELFYGFLWFLIFLQGFRALLNFIEGNYHVSTLEILIGLWIFLYSMVNKQLDRVFQGWTSTSESWDKTIELLREVTDSYGKEVDKNKILSETIAKLSHE